MKSRSEDTLVGLVNPTLYRQRVEKTQAEAPEVRVVNEKTGGAKGQKDIRFDLLPWEQLWEVARLYGVGAKKYNPGNWRKGYDFSLSYAAMMRHATQFWTGESYDEETGCHHMASVVFHALALMYFDKHCPEMDDRMEIIK